MANLLDLFKEDWTDFLELSNDGVIVADGEGRIIYMNSAAERLEKTGKDSIIGKYAKQLQEEGIYQNSVSVKVLESHKPETVIDIKNNRNLVITGTPIFKEDGKSIKWIFINERDISKLEMMKRELIGERSKMEFYKKELERMQRNAEEREELQTGSPKMKQIMELLTRLAPTEVSVLIEGESGSGKDVHAAWIHKHSHRSEKPYIKIDCGALSENLLESELFGYVRGAFTGARKEGKSGLVEEADGGTLFLDEIGEMPLSLQVKLLRLIQDRTFVPVGGVEEKHVDIRIISATNRSLKQMVKDGTFREDLYYRLDVVSIKLPPLRERKEDLFHFIQLFLKQYNEKHNQNKRVSAAATAMLCDYMWPGNVREMSNVMERLIVTTPQEVIEPKDVAYALPDYHEHNFPEEPDSRASYKDAVASFEKKYFQTVMDRGMTIKETSEAIGISESTLKRKLRTYKVFSRKGETYLDE